MINFLSNWIEQIAIAVIIVSIFELILPKGNLKKYIDIILIIQKDALIHKIDIRIDNNLMITN